MLRSPARPCLRSLDETSAGEVQSLLASARMFKQSGAGRPLRGRHAALLCESPDGDSAQVFAAAATALGASVVRLRPSTARLADPRSVRDMALMFGRLYCAVGCEGVNPSTASQLARWAGVPVFDAVAGSMHPTRLLGDLLTMLEHARKPPAEITLCVRDEAHSPLAAAWRRLGELTGVGVRHCDAGDAGDDTTVRRCDFICEPPPPGQAGEPPTLRAVDGSDAGAQALTAQQAENHRYVVQALLADTIG